MVANRGLRSNRKVAIGASSLASGTWPGETPPQETSSCDSPVSLLRGNQGYRYQEINVTRKVDDDVALLDAINPESAVWAARDFNQHIQVWQIGVVGIVRGGRRHDEPG